VKNIKLHYFNMAWYYLFKTISFEVTDFTTEFGIEEFTPESVSTFINQVKGSKLFLLNMMRKFTGY